MILTISPAFEIDLKRIVDKRLGEGPRFTWEYESLIENLISEEARRLKVTDEDLKEAKE